MPHVVLVYGDVALEETDNNRPLIKGVDLRMLKYLGEHDDEREWDFIPWKGQVALLIPKRYVILKRFKILSIYLHFANGRQAQAEGQSTPPFYFAPGWYNGLNYHHPKHMRIRKSTEEDLAAFAEWHGADRLEEQTCRPVRDGRRMPPSTEIHRLTFLMEGLEGPVGKFSYFDHNERNRSCEFGYVLDPRYRGQGLGEELVRAGVDAVFRDETLNLNKLYCQTAEFNLPSVRTLEKLGLKRDGVLREHHELRGKFYDDYIFSLLRAEWEEMRGRDAGGNYQM
jgi:RimJ/RimL family protein N-acetyltransferase